MKTDGAVFSALRKMSPAVSVGVLTADLMNLGAELSTIERAGVKVLHVDVMDGCFCPMMTVGPPFIKALKTPLFKDVHLMIDEPVGKVADYVAAGADMITVHVESTRHIHRVFQQLGAMKNANDPDRGIVRGVALNPGTPVSALEPIIGEVEMILLLAVNPGWGGQKFIASTGERVTQVKSLLCAAERHGTLIAVDGGITRDNVSAVRALGVDLIITGSAVFDGKAVAENARFMLDAMK